VDPRTASDAEARLSLQAVYTALRTRSPDDPEAELSARRPPAREERRLLSALEQLNRHPRLVLLGDPGSGKSTFVNFVALCLAGEALQRPDANLALLRAPLPPEDDQGREKEKPQSQPWDHRALMPVRVILRDFTARGLPPAGQPATAQHLWAFIAAELEAAALSDLAEPLRQTLLGQGGLVMLDGLDEVPEAGQRRAQLKQAVEDFAATFHKCRLLVTGRTYAYQRQDWRLANFAVAELAPFSPGQIRAFVSHWYAHIAPLRHMAAEAAQGGAALLERAIFNSARLRELAERPLLLTLMASLHAWRGGSLPEKREELYHDAVDLLLDQWERPKVVRDAAGSELREPSLAEWLKVDRDKVRGLLNELAYRAHAAQPAGQAGTADVAEGELVAGLMRLNQNRDLNPARLVDYLSQRAGLLLPRGEGVYTFPHRTFQEYLAACHLTDYRYPGELAGLARREPNRWREVALLAGAKAARGGLFGAWALANKLCPHAADVPDSADDAWGALQAGQLLLETMDLSQVDDEERLTVERLRRWQRRLVEGRELPAQERARAGDTLARLGDPRPEAMTVEGMQFCYVPPGDFVMGDGDDKHTYKSLVYGYWIGRHPVTVAQWRQFVRASAHRPNDDDSLRDPANRPVRWVNWYDALAFCDWLTKQFSAQLPPGYRFTLPNEPEWEKAARGGLQLPAQPSPLTLLSLGLALPAAPVALAPNPMPEREYPWGQGFDLYQANTDEAQIGTTSAIGCFQSGASPYGCLDLSGNVWEWTRSNYQSYPYNSRDGREKLDASRDVGRVLRGGSFGHAARNARCAYRYRRYPVLAGRLDGFRVVASPSRL